ncbi:MAG TPA: DUF2336 domain-containing protein [Xanthobacteraceae bacterium]|nr:DUF2336 domain-containing protein [Xanthobacteraceae bacterium]
MAASVGSLIPELEEVLQHGSREKRAEALKRITSLFVDGAPAYTDEHVGLFDDVFGLLIAEIETKARAELSAKLAPVENAPARTVQKLAQDDDITVAGPVLTRSNCLDETALLNIAKSKGQAHLLAISNRGEIGEAVADVLVSRGDRMVARTVADNRRARLSETAFSTLVKRAEGDGILAEKVGLRPDIPDHLFRALLMQATDVVQKRLLVKAKPETAAEIRRVLAKVSHEIGAKAPPRDYKSAQRIVQQMQQTGALGERELAEFAEAGRFEETVVALAVLCQVPLEVVDRLLCAERADPVLILCKSAGFSWPTVRAIMVARPGKQGTSSQGLDDARANLERLSASTAQRVVRFWQVRPVGIRNVA